MSPASADTLRLLQITDTHLGASAATEIDGVNTLRSLQDVLAAAGTEPAQAWLASGDLAHDGSAAAYRQLRTCFTSVPLPVYCLPGNHDDPAQMQTTLIGDRISMPASVTLGAWQILLLNTHVPGREGGELGSQRLEQLRGLLAAPTAAHLLIVMHHPPVRIGSSWMDAMMLADGEAFFRLVDTAPALRAVVWGHVHQDFDERRGDVRLLATPSTCVQFRPGASRYEKDPLPPGYRRLALHADGRLETAVVRLPASCASN